MAQLFKKRRLENKARDFKIPDFEAKIAEIQKWHESYKDGSLQKKTESQCEQAFNQSFFEKVLGYTPMPADEYTYEPKADTAATGQKPDAVLAYFQRDGETPNRVGAVVEIKDVRVPLDRPQKRKNPETPIQQGFRYKGQYKRCDFVIATNFYDIRLLKDNQLDYQQWTLDSLVDAKDDYLNFRTFYYLLCADNLLAKRGNSKTESLLSEIRVEQEGITKNFYSEYKDLRKELIKDIVSNNSIPKEEFGEVVEKSQKIIDRLVFVAFCEDLDLLPENTLLTVIKHAQNSFGNVWDTMKGFFNAVDSGSEKLGIPDGFNGELFKPDFKLDSLKISDAICEKFLEIGKYDFGEDLSVNILGHIFEQSISDLEELKNLGSVEEVFDPKKSKRKKDGIFYTPEYIVDYIVRNSVGTYLQEKEAEILAKHGVKEDINDKNYQKRLEEAYIEYQKVLQNIKVLDPACGSGAFLVNVFDFLLAENVRVGEILGGLFSGEAYFKSILQNNIYGVDLNPESVEITKLSLWLKTAEKGKKLATLDGNIKCGNSLIDDPEVAGDRAFKWEEEFKSIMDNGGFDVVVGNPPYVRVQNLDHKQIDWFKIHKEVAYKRIDISIMFFELSKKILKHGGILSFITSNQFQNAEYGEMARQFIADKFKIREIIDFGDLPVFQDALTYVSIFCFENNSSNSFKYLRINDLSLFDSEVQKNGIIIAKHQIGKEQWILKSQSEILLLEKFNKFKQLNKVGKCWAGLFTGLDDVLMFNFNEQTNLNNEIFLPVIRAQDIDRYSSVKPSKKVIYPYEFKNNKTEVLSEGTLATKYPNTHEYLNNKKHLLVKRKDSRKTYENRDDWYSLTRFGRMDVFSKEKIVSPGEVREHKFAITDKYAGFSCARVFAITIEDPSFDIRFVLGILNSKVAKFFLQSIAALKQGGYYTYSSGVLGQTPIPNSKNQKNIINLVCKAEEFSHNFVKKSENFIRVVKNEYQIEKIPRKAEKYWELDFDEFVKQLKLKKLSLDEKSELLDFFEKNKTEALELKSQIDATDKEIDQMVYELYGLTEEEIAIVEQA